MTMKQHRNLLLTGIIMSIVVVLGMTSIAANNPFSQPNNEEFSQSVSVSRPSSDMNEFYAQGGKSWVTLSIDSPKEEKVTEEKVLQKTMVVDFPSSAYSYDYVTINFTKDMPYVYPPSVGLTHSAEEIVQAAQDGTPFQRINTADLVNITPSEFVLHKGESKTVSLTITVPQTIVDEFDGTYIPISPNYEVIPPTGEEKSPYLIQRTTDGIMLQILAGGMN